MWGTHSPVRDLDQVWRDTRVIASFDKFVEELYKLRLNSTKPTLISMAITSFE